MMRVPVRSKREQRENLWKKIDTTIVALDWAPEEDVMMVDTRNKSYANKGKGGPPKTTFSPSSSSQQTNPQVTRVLKVKRFLPLLSSSKYNILETTSYNKSRCIFIGYGHHPRTTKASERFMEGKTSTIASLSEESNEEECT
jgi:hypothetical protein